MRKWRPLFLMVFLLLSGGAYPSWSAAEENDLTPTALDSAPVDHATSGRGGIVRTPLPGTLLWTPPMPNRKEPRFYLNVSSYGADDMKSVNDFGIGGTIALHRWSAEGACDEGVEIDAFVVALTRFAELDAMTAVDYRVGVPLTFAFGDWTGKVSYEHTSAHLGDEYMARYNVKPRNAVKEEVVLGLSNYVRDDLRIYGQFGCAFHLSTFNEGAQKTRYEIGAEWANPRPTGRRGSPFAAVGLEFRGDANYTPNITAQAGWMWRGEAMRPTMRIGVEGYDGRSPYFQLIDRHESWVAFMVAWDY